MNIHKIIPNNKIASSPFYFGGEEAHVLEWPKNPDGDYLTLLFTINCDSANSILKREDIPKTGVIHVFSTYDKQSYFLDQITYDEEFVNLKSHSPGYTFVTHSDKAEVIKSPINHIPRKNAELISEDIQDEEFTVTSLISDLPPRGLNFPEALKPEYNFLCQVYSSDFPDPYKDALYLTDATGFLAIRKTASDSPSIGYFFAHTA